MDTKEGRASLSLVGVKPCMERVIDLFQGFETSDPVEVVTDKTFGSGKFYVAVT